MEIKYVYSESTVEPKELEITKSTVYMRKDMSSENRDGVTFYTYKEAALSYEEFGKYYSAVLFKDVESLKTGQANGDNNQLVIMEAIADLYDIIASMQGGTE